MKKLLILALMASLFSLAPATMAGAAELDMIMITQSRHAAHSAQFDAAAAKDAAIRADIQKLGTDVAFTKWMQRNHPYVYAAACAKNAQLITAHCKHTNLMSEFDSLANKHADIGAAVKAEGYDAAFVDWLRANHPAEYAEHLTAVAATKPVADPHAKGNAMPAGCGMPGM
ncbi:MAG TPA: hypothetical protein VGK19_26065 [Capsulimonadaceae bacterium]|jgi:hypothetical protein